MLRGILCGLEFLGAVVVLITTSTFLFWLGRPIEDTHRGELVVDPDIDSDDLGVDVDGAPCE